MWLGTKKNVANVRSIFLVPISMICRAMRGGAYFFAYVNESPMAFQFLPWQRFLSHPFMRSPASGGLSMRACMCAFAMSIYGMHIGCMCAHAFNSRSRTRARAFNGCGENACRYVCDENMPLRDDSRAESDFARAECTRMHAYRYSLPFIRLSVDSR